MIAINKNNTRDTLSQIPKNPGCYMFKSSKGEVLYVGKAKNLQNRIKSYFFGYGNLEERKKQMIKQSDYIDYIVTDSEIEALILETNLIKKYKTKYNILQRDDKYYSWVLIEKRLPNKNDFPRIRIIRDTQKQNYLGDLYGPFPSQMPLKRVLQKLRKLFPYASCNRAIYVENQDPLLIKSSNSKPCLFYHIGLCQGPCAYKIQPKEYMKSINNIKKFFESRKNEIIEGYTKKMILASKLMKYEEAKEWKQKIDEIKFVTAHIKINSEVDDINIATLQQKDRINALSELISKLKFPSDKLYLHPDFRIECYDISNIQGTNPVGSMTVMIFGELRPDLYRRFRINSKNTPDDFGMMQELLERRLKHISNSEDKSLNSKPDLIIVDGGKGQLNAATKVLKMYNFYDQIPVIAIAKKNEEIFKINEQFSNTNSNYTQFCKILLSKRSACLFVIQRIRDEAHRFAINYHKKLRSKKMLFISSKNQ